MQLIPIKAAVLCRITTIYLGYRSVQPVNQAAVICFNKKEYKSSNVYLNNKNFFIMA